MVDAPVSEAGGSYPVRVQVPLFALCHFYGLKSVAALFRVLQRGDALFRMVLGLFSDKNNLPFIQDLIDFMCSHKDENYLEQLTP